MNCLDDSEFVPVNDYVSIGKDRKSVYIGTRKVRVLEPIAMDNVSLSVLVHEAVTYGYNLRNDEVKQALTLITKGGDIATQIQGFTGPQMG